MRAVELADLVRSRFPDVVVARDEATVLVGRDDLLEALAWLRSEADLGFDFLSSLTATDWPGRVPRYWVLYELLSTVRKHRIRVKVGLVEEDAHVSSVAPTFPTADWFERETFDFYGIVFEGHPNLPRILLPDDWEGYPLRKTEYLGGVDTRFEGAFIPPVDRRTT